ncbi:MAG: Eco57I restriction-modification methylase domain-containing protein [Paludibacteraceae bacterium]|nr:Eco57I restriction-modification methylase domain-containing protein [Paludibacteraceae bacterium]
MGKAYNSFRPELIYVFRINDILHSGSLKIGKTTISDDTPLDAAPNSRTLNEAAKARIRQYTKTAGVAFELLYTEISIAHKNKEVFCIDDKEVHQVLLRSGIKRSDFTDNMGSEWFECDLETAKRAIAAAKERRTSLLPHEITLGQSPIVFRPEQQNAIDKTVKKFQKSNQMLWNAKMRFGKTLCALQVVRQMNFKRTIILTHRPVVDEGWFDDFKKIFYDTHNYQYGSKGKGGDFKYMENACALGRVNYIYFASIQDLRGSEQVGGKFDKNHKVFSINWDCVIVDEAHEGTQTLLGKNVLEALIKKDTKVLQLSGTPFNLFDDFNEDEIFTWDYVMEQKAKAEWDDKYFGDSNPYAGLPAMNIYTFDLGSLMGHYMDMDVAFNFTEFFRTNDHGRFVHEKDVRSFLDLLVKKDKESMFPYSNEEFRENFRHTLWRVPGVRAAKALSQMLKQHTAFGKFEIVNVAGDGDEDAERGDALEMVKEAIKKHDHTITLSCGKLTTGVSVPEWTAVMMLSGTFNTSASAYMQTIFRVQTPATIDGQVKKNCYVFDFAPDRTLKVIAETAKVQARAGKTTDNDRKTLGDFLNFCPVISCEGTQMRNKITADRLFEQLKKIYVERVVSSGFEDKALYNEELLKLDDIALEEFAKLKKIIGATKAMAKSSDIDINNQGLTNEQREEIEKIEKKKRQREPLTEEEKEKLEALKKAKEQRNNAISILRGISIRMPLLIYGAELTGNIKEVTLENFTDLIDNLSWTEFMPKGVDKEIFRNIRKYYDPDIFLAAGKRIRALAEATDRMSIEQRISQIAAIFANFRNPDKETVLTPWRVVNMHIADCLGGYCFYNKEYTEQIEEPRLVLHDDVTERVFHPDAKVLEINSKSGLYPLYVAYSIYRAKVKNSLFEIEEIEQQQQLWDEVIRENIFVICKTQMAKSITRRTLLGFREGKANLHAFDDLLNQVQNNKENLIKKITRPNFWNYKTELNMLKFDAVVGNPPYQTMDKGECSSSTAIYPMFIDVACKLNGALVSMITPSRWMTKQGRGLSEEWAESILKSNHFVCIIDFLDANNCFPNVDIKGGVCYFLFDHSHNGNCRYIINHSNTIVEKNSDLGKWGMAIRDEKADFILTKVANVEGADYHLIKSFSSYVCPRHQFDQGTILSTSWRGYVEHKDNEHNIKCYLNKQLLSSGYGWVSLKDIPKNHEAINYRKIYISKAYGAGENFPHQIIGVPFFGEKNSVCTDTYIVIRPQNGFDSDEECNNALLYIKTKFFRYLVFVKKKTQDAARDVYQFVPIQDFTDKSDINWSKPVAEIEQQLYKKYNLTADEIAFIESMIKPM